MITKREARININGVNYKREARININGVNYIREGGASSFSKTVRDFIKSKYNLDKPTQNWDGDFSCYNNQLTSLEGSPQEVDGDFDCSYNQLTSLEGGPQEVSGDFRCSDNERKFTKEEVSAVCNVKGRIVV